MMPPRKNALPFHRGFTLLELLIVIALVALLAILGLTATRHLNSQVKTVRCVNNLRQCATLLLQYAAEHNNRITYKIGGSGASNRLWASYVAEALDVDRNTTTPVPALDILYCPVSKPYKHDPQNSTWSWDCYGGFFVSSSQVKTVPMDEPGGKWTGLEVTLANITSLGSYPILLDSIISSSKMQHMRVQSYSASSDKGSLFLAHGNKANVAFHDGHVSSLNPERLRALGFTSAVNEQFTIVPLR